MIKHEEKTAGLRQLLYSGELEFLLEAHNGISARIVEEAGFKGIWASGLALSAQFGVRDSNEASWTQVIEMLEFMSDITSVPILLDGDTGYGNFNNMRRLVKKLEQRHIAGVCIEDKVFPKTNSFIDGERQALADVDEFCGKIKAGKDIQSDDDFCIVARVEALIAGWGMQEALKRAEAYFNAGADAILIHSKKNNAEEILEFASEWDNRCPLVIVPTKYYSTPLDVYRKYRISTVIWANHMIRASVSAMQKISRKIHETGTVAGIEDDIASVNHLFRLQGTDELDSASKKYLNTGTETAAIVLAASRGNALHELTSDRPKVMLKVNGKPLLERLTTEFRSRGLKEITVVAGYKAESINVDGINIVINDQYETTGELVSLKCAMSHFRNNMVIVYGDLLFRSYILADLLEYDDDIVIVVDSAEDLTEITGMPDYVYCSKSDDRSLFRQEVMLEQIVEDGSSFDRRPSGRWIGMLYAGQKGRKNIEDSISALESGDDFTKLTIPDLLNHLVKSGYKIRVHYINGHWLDINELEDLMRAGDFAHETNNDSD